MPTATNEVTDVLIKRGFKRAAIVGMATGSSTVFEGVVTLGVDGSSTAAAVVGSILIFVGVVLTTVSAVGYKKYTKYRARQVDAVMAKARRIARGEGASPALLDLGSGGELLRVMTACDNTMNNCEELLMPPEAFSNGRIHNANTGDITRASGKSGSVDNLTKSPKNVDALATKQALKNGPMDRVAVTKTSRKSVGSIDHLDLNLRTIDIMPGMVVMPVYLEESSCTVEVYMPDEHEAPSWLYSDMLLLFWLAVFFASIGHTFVNTAFIILGIAFDHLPNTTVAVLCSVFSCIGGVCLTTAGALVFRCYKVYHKYLRESVASPFEDRSSSSCPTVWQLL